MKALLRWLILATAAFAALAGGYHWHLSANPHRVLVLLDTSFDMRPALSQLPALLKSLEGRRYTEYALETEKAPVHDFAASLTPGRIDAYAPRDFSRLAARSGRVFAEADEIVLISNADADELRDLPGWRVLRP